MLVFTPFKVLLGRDFGALLKTRGKKQQQQQNQGRKVGF
jgi:hypothetical protein